MALRLLITEIIDIHRGLYCVAGRDVSAAPMVCSLPDGVSWRRALIEAAAISSGHTVPVVSNRIRLRGVYPDCNEDQSWAQAFDGRLRGAGEQRNKHHVMLNGVLW